MIPTASDLSFGASSGSSAGDRQWHSWPALAGTAALAVTRAPVVGGRRCDRHAGTSTLRHVGGHGAAPRESNKARSSPRGRHDSSVLSWIVRIIDQQRETPDWQSPSAGASSGMAQTAVIGGGVDGKLKGDEKGPVPCHVVVGWILLFLDRRTTGWWPLGPGTGRAGLPVALPLLLAPPLCALPFSPPSPPPPPQNLQSLQGTAAFRFYPYVLRSRVFFNTRSALYSTLRNCSLPSSLTLALVLLHAIHLPNKQLKQSP